VQGPAIQCIVQRIGGARHAHGIVHECAYFLVQVGAAGRIVRLRRAGGGHFAIHLGNQRAHAVTAHGDGLHHRHAEPLREFRHVDDDAAATRRVHHVEREHHRPAQPLDLEHEAQVQAQVGGIGHADDEVGRRLAGVVAFQHVAGDALVRAGRVEAVGAGQVEHVQHAAGRRGETAFLALDGDAGVVGHLLPAAGELVEQRGLATVRIADQGNTQCGGTHGLASARTCTRAASARRSAKRVEPI